MTVTPVEAPFEEWMRFGVFDGLAGTSAVAFLQWEKLKVPFTIAVANREHHPILRSRDNRRTRSSGCPVRRGDLGFSMGTRCRGKVSDAAEMDGGRRVDRCSCILLVAALVLTAPAEAQRIQMPNAAEIQLGLEKLTVLGSVLYVAAHPDDENTAALAYFSKGEKWRTGYLELLSGVTVVRT